MSAQPTMHLEKPNYLIQDMIEMPSLVPVPGRPRVAVHGIALPHHLMPTPLDRIDNLRQHIADPLAPHPADQRQPTGNPPPAACPARTPAPVPRDWRRSPPSAYPAGRSRTPR